MMKSNANTPQEYIDTLPIERKVVIQTIRKEILNNLPKGFTECMSYGMLAFVVPHAIYPNGYHCNPQEPLPFINLASQKNHVSIYHMGLYTNSELLDWFAEEYPKHTSSKLDMGKCCIRFKKMDNIPYKLIGLLCTKWTPQEWINQYEMLYKR